LGFAPLASSGFSRLFPFITVHCYTHKRASLNSEKQREKRWQGFGPLMYIEYGPILVNPALEAYPKNPGMDIIRRQQFFQKF